VFLMTPTILRNFFSARATRPYPTTRREPFPEVRGELVNDIEKCIFCSICATKCPSQCLHVDKTAGTWECEAYACVNCGVCVENCPTKSLSQKPLYQPVGTARVHIRLQGVPPKSKKKEVAPSAAPASEAAAPADDTQSSGDAIPKV